MVIAEYTGSFIYQTAALCFVDRLPQKIYSMKDMTNTAKEQFIFTHAIQHILIKQILYLPKFKMTLINDEPPPR